MSYVDLHVHYVPGIDDGVRTTEDGIRLCQGLAEIGFGLLVATPHMRPGMFDNERADIELAFGKFETQSAGMGNLPKLGLASEHFYDEVFFQRFEAGAVLPYPGGHAVLVEFPDKRFPVGVAQGIFKLSLGGLTPVLAHPERYHTVFRDSKALEDLLDMGVMAQLDLMSLVGRYGRKPKKTAIRLLEEEAYFIACSDAHRAADVTEVKAGIAVLKDIGGDDLVAELLSRNPRKIIAGTFDS